LFFCFFAVQATLIQDTVLSLTFKFKEPIVLYYQLLSNKRGRTVVSIEGVPSFE